MKSQYPHSPVTYQQTEPMDYLENYAGIRQISVEKTIIFKAELEEYRKYHSSFSPALDKGEDDGIGSFFSTSL